MSRPSLTYPVLLVMYSPILIIPISFHHYYFISSGVLEPHERGEGVEGMRESAALERNRLPVQGLYVGDTTQCYETLHHATCHAMRKFQIPLICFCINIILHITYTCDLLFVHETSSASSYYREASLLTASPSIIASPILPRILSYLFSVTSNMFTLPSMPLHCITFPSLPSPHIHSILFSQITLQEDGQHDSAIRTMTEHTVAFQQELFLDCVQKVRERLLHSM